MKEVKNHFVIDNVLNDGKTINIQKWKRSHFFTFETFFFVVRFFDNLN